MITEYSQIISTVLKDEISEEVLFKPTHLNHPATKWASEGNNLKWLSELLNCLINEYDYRFGKPNKFIKSREICTVASAYVNAIKPGPLKFELIMPEEFKNGNPIASYRNYYKIGKSKLLTYTKREIPNWL